ncbi:MAG: transposase [Bryobacteraceae bacterium]
MEFLCEMVGACPPKQEVHVILDSLSAHKTSKVQAFLDDHPNVDLHFTPTYSSWLNQV